MTSRSQFLQFARGTQKSSRLGSDEGKNANSSMPSAAAVFETGAFRGLGKAPTQDGATKVVSMRRQRRKGDAGCITFQMKTVAFVFRAAIDRMFGRQSSGDARIGYSIFVIGLLEMTSVST